MLIDGIVLSDGMDMIRYLDQKLQELNAANKMATGIVLSTAVRKELSRACQSTMGMAIKPEETVNKYRGVLLIEDGIHSDRLEVVAGEKTSVTMPLEGNSVLNLKRPNRG